MTSYTSTDQLLHRLSQVIAKYNRTCVVQKEDDSHTNLYFDSLGNRIVGRWSPTLHGETVLCFNLDKFSFVLTCRPDKELFSVAVEGLPLKVVEKRVYEELSKAALNTNGFLKDLHYSIPDYGFRDNPIAMPEKGDLAKWIKYRQLANEACLELIGYAQVWSEIRIWPHHFDTGILLTPRDNLSVGFGLAMEDDLAGSPYFYLAAYPEGGKITYQDLPQNDSWRWEVGNNWKGAILTLETLENLPQPIRIPTIRAFLKQCYDWMMQQ